MNATNEEIGKIAATLSRLGHCYDGGSPDSATEIAVEWVEFGFDNSEVELWAAVGCWSPSVAYDLRCAGMLPHEVHDTCQVLIEQVITSGREPREVYTDGSPIYAACNGDISTDVIIECYADAHADDTDDDAE